MRTARPRFGIRGKLLAFYGAGVLLVVAAEFASQAAAFRANRDYESRLARYHAVHRFRVSFETHRALTERLLREGVSEEGERQLREGVLGLAWLFEAVRPAADDSLAAFFETQAAERALDAYLPQAANALARRKSGDPDYYADFAKADRIARYADGYLSKLLSLELEQGEERFRIEARGAARARAAALAVIIGTGALALGFSSLAATRLTLPLRRLAEASARIAKGDLDVPPVGAHSGDEVAVLASAFNSMSASIRRLVGDLRGTAELERRLREEEAELALAERALSEARFMALQDQIRPHFLFNALNAIARSALLEGSERTSELAHGLGRLMRYALAGPEPLASLEEEFAVLREYLAFQGARFGSRLSWTVSLEGEVAGIMAPRFSVQPLVENAVRHGIEPLEQGGRVLIDARRRRERVLIRIIDSGAGMDAFRLGAIRNAIAEARTRALARGSRGAEGDRVGLVGHQVEGAVKAARQGGEGTDNAIGLGLANVAGRLALRHGESARLSVASLPGRGTAIRVSFPLDRLAQLASQEPAP